MHHNKIGVVQPPVLDAWAEQWCTPRPEGNVKQTSAPAGGRQAEGGGGRMVFMLQVSGKTRVGEAVKCALNTQ